MSFFLVNNKLTFYNKISVKNESQETDLYVGEIAYQMRYTSLPHTGSEFIDVIKYVSVLKI
jgi:hypothetical protein